MKPLRAAVIGVGSMGMHHARVYHHMQDVELVAVADIDPRATGEAKRLLGAEAYEDAVQMLDEASPDVVSVTVPTRLHQEIATEAIQRRVHVLVEKPLALSAEACGEMIVAADDRKVILMVGFIERFNPAVVEVKKKMDEGVLGEVYQIHARREGPYLGRDHDIGAIMDLATHDIDIMRHVMSSEIDRVYAEVAYKNDAELEDLFHGVLRFRNGTIGILQANWMTPVKIRELFILGQEGLFKVDYLTQEMYWYASNVVDSDWPVLQVVLGAGESELVKLPIRKKEPLQAEIEAFVMAVREGRASPVDGTQGQEVIRLANSLKTSAETHEVVWL